MACDEQDREDLLGEARALVERIELQLPDGQPVFAGFRRDGGPSVYFGAAPVYQFNSELELRRAFVTDRLYKAEQGRLVQLTRERHATEVQLIRHELSSAETQVLLTELTARLQELAKTIADKQVVIIGQVPMDKDVLTRVANWLANQPLPPQIASSPMSS
ncbi:MAG: hypothetical protein JSS27_20355 [Planctomycetes bacterium]|nr:hypothetical protein [Planctomycetota bacterium]